MESQLSKVYSHTLSSFQQEERFLIEGMEDHLRQKAEELQRLQMCFENEIKEIQSYENKEKLFKMMISSVLKTFRNIKSQLNSIRGIWEQAREWKEQINRNLRELLKLINKDQSKEKEIVKEQKIINSRFEVNQDQFKRIQSKYKEQIQRQTNTIIQLQTTLMNKSMNRIESSPSYHLRSTCKLIGADYSPKIPKSQKDILLNSRQFDKSITKQSREQNRNDHHLQSILNIRKSASRSINKQQILQKIRQYQRNKNLSKKNQKSCQINLQNQENKNSFLIPSLPHLKLIDNFQSPIVNGFDALIIGNKEVYKGMWKKGMFQGRGKYYSSGWVYDGEFRMGKIEGFGTLTFGKNTFIGKFINGKAQGEGKLYYCKDDHIDGIWRDNILVKQFD